MLILVAILVGKPTEMIEAIKIGIMMTGIKLIQVQVLLVGVELILVQVLPDVKEVATAIKLMSASEKQKKLKLDF